MRMLADRWEVWWRCGGKRVGGGMRPSSTRSLITVSTLLVSGGAVSFWRHHHSHHHLHHHHHHHHLFPYTNHYLHHHQCLMTVMRTPSNAQSCVPKGIDTSPRVTSVGVGRWMGGRIFHSSTPSSITDLHHDHHQSTSFTTHQFVPPQPSPFTTPPPSDRPWTGCH